jgi:hypothetical protein
VGPVRVDVVTTHGEKGVTENLRVKQEKTALLFKSLVDEMNNPEGITTKDLHLNKMEVPAWLS